MRRLGAAAAARARGERDEALVAALDSVTVWAFELGRLVPNRPLRPGKASQIPRGGTVPGGGASS